MNNNDLFQNAFDAIDDEFIVEAKSPKIRIAARRKKIFISSVAACVAAVLVAIPSIKILNNLNDNGFTNSEDIETIYKEEYIYIEGSKPSDQDNSDNITNKPQNDITNNQNITITVNDLFSGEAVLPSGSTTSYQKTYVPDVKYLYIKPIPTDKYVTIYEHSPVEQKEPTESEFRAFADKYLPKIADATGTLLPEYDIENDTTGGYHISTIGKTEDVDIFLSSNYISFGKSFIYTETDVPLTLYGETVAIDQTKSDEEIIESLSGIKEKLGKLFETTFVEPKTTRKYSSSHTNGADWIYVYFKSNDNSGTIQITFDNFANHVSDTVSYTNLYNAHISYFPKNSETPANSISEQVELLPLEKAEEYLSKGYVLAMGGCPLCQAQQEPVDFTDYDYVSFSYSIYNNKEIPFYAFYKNIGASENGNMIFAYTYVPAVEVEGYEEYFENKHANHSSSYSSDEYIDNGE